MLPPQVAAHLRALGEDLALARKRRAESRQLWATRLGVTEPTVMRLERGDPSVSMAVYATALWQIGRAGELATLAAPEKDMGALEGDVRKARARSSRQGDALAQRVASSLGGKKDMR